MNHRIACSLCPYNLPGGRGVTLVRRFVVFNFCWHCYRTRRAECEAFMNKQTAPVSKTKNFKRPQLQAVGVPMLVALLMLLATACYWRGADMTPAPERAVTFARHVNV